MESMEVGQVPGVYVVAVSGGVDSMALLDMLRQNPEFEVVVAHYDHGIREDSHLDRQLVMDVADRHGLKAVYEEGGLGPNASEAAARKARYDFLHRVRKVANAKAIITAHHQDDLVETAILNMIRGTGRRGLVSLRSRDTVLRPLLHVPKSNLIKYAQANGLVWREDSTNNDTRYLRNYIRHKVIPRMSEVQRQELLQHIGKLNELHKQIEAELTTHLHIQPGLDRLDRHWFIMLPHNVAREVMAAWLMRHKVSNISSQQLERLVHAAKTYSPGSLIDIDKVYILQVRKDVLALMPLER